MPANIVMNEGYVSREGGVGDSASFDLVYFVSNDDLSELEPEDATVYALDNRPATYEVNGFDYPYQSYKIRQINLSVYQFTLTYGMQANNSNKETKALSFNVGGATSHITTSDSKTIYRDSSVLSSNMDFQGAIGVELNDDGTKARVRGVEVYTPVLEYTYTQQFDDDDVDDAYIEAVYNLAGKVNAAVFFNRPAGTVLFKGARGSKKGPDKWEIGFDFEYSPNVTNLTIGGITGINKTGWQYLDTLFVPRTPVGGLRLVVPGQTTVHTVYKNGDFNVLNLI